MSSGHGLLPGVVSRVSIGGDWTRSPVRRGTLEADSNPCQRARRTKANARATGVRTSPRKGERPARGGRAPYRHRITTKHHGGGSCHGRRAASTPLHRPPSPDPSPNPLGLFSSSQVLKFFPISRRVRMCTRTYSYNAENLRILRIIYFYRHSQVVGNLRILRFNLRIFPRVGAVPAP